MTKKISILGVLGKSSRNFNQFKISKIEGQCKECGAKTTPEKPYGVVYIPKSLGVDLLITVKIDPKRLEGE